MIFALLSYDHLSYCQRMIYGNNPKRYEQPIRIKMEEKQYVVYILASKRYGTLYTGITSNLVQRIYQHKECEIEGFTKKYKVHHLVYYEIHSDVYEAITREKCIKKWKRAWKIHLIEHSNPQWIDLSPGLFELVLT